MSQPTRTSTATMATQQGPLHVETVGSGPPAVLWHSLFVDSTTWDRLRAPLAAEHRLVIIDGPKHGGSPPVRHPFTLDDCADAAIDILDQPARRRAARPESPRRGPRGRRDHH